MILLPNRQPEACPSAPSASMPASPSAPPAPPVPTDDPSTPWPRRRRPFIRWAAVGLMTVSAAWLFAACRADESSVESYVGVTIDDETITSFVDQRRQEIGIPGLALAIVNDGEIVYAENFGQADVEAGRPVTDQTIFEGASLSKSVFAQFVMTFVEDGDLDLDRPLHRYLPHPDVDDPRGEQITARMVLSHRAGFANWRAGGPDAPLTIDFDPGTDYQYSGEGYQYLAMVLAEIASTDWAGLEALFQQRIAEPLGLEHTVFVANPATQASKAEPYDANGTLIEVDAQAHASAGGNRLGPEVFVAGASIHSTTADFSRWMIGVMDSEILTDDSYDELFTRHSSLPSESFDLSYTLGFFQPHLPLTDFYGHSGNNEGFTSFYVLDPDDDWGFVILTNSQYGHEFGEELFEYLLVGPSIPKFAVTVAAIATLVGVPVVFVLVSAVRFTRRRLAW